MEIVFENKLTSPHFANLSGFFTAFYFSLRKEKLLLLLYSMIPLAVADG